MPIVVQVDESIGGKLALLNFILSGIVAEQYVAHEIFYPKLTLLCLLNQPHSVIIRQVCSTE